MNRPEIIHLFPETICSYKVNTRDILEEIVNEDWVRLTIEDQVANPPEMTRDLYLLEKYPDIKQMIMDHFYQYKNEHLRFVHNDFVITTSWGTKTGKGGSSTYHDHKNSMFSGVFYVNGGDDCAPLIFKKQPPHSFWIMPDEYNQLNSNTFNFTPEHQSLVFFPSHLNHRIGMQSNSENRYSIAFNIMPVGTLGFADSHVDINVNRISVDPNWNTY